MPRVESKRSVSATPKPSTSQFYRCPESDCKYVSPRKFDLKRHALVHNKDNAEKYTCHHCGHTTGQMSNLKTHMRGHSGEKPFECPYEPCTKAFGDPSSFLRHKRRVHGYVPPYRAPRTKVPSYVTSLPSPSPSPSPLPSTPSIHGYSTHSPAPSSSSYSQSSATLCGTSRSQSPQYSSDTGASSSRLGNRHDSFSPYPTPPPDMSTPVYCGSPAHVSSIYPSSQASYLGLHGFHVFDSNPTRPGYVDPSMPLYLDVGYMRSQPRGDYSLDDVASSSESCDSQVFDAGRVSSGYTTSVDDFLAAIKRGG